MIIAKEKRRENIAEYVIYMFQIEDVIRGCEFNINTIEASMINKFQQPEQVKTEIRNWYANLIIMMKEEKITNKGHLKFIKELISELNSLHNQLMDRASETKYHEIYRKAAINITVFKEKMGDKTLNEIEVCFNALYALLLMRLKKQQVSENTKQAMSTFSNLLAQLSFKFKQLELGN